MDSQRLRIDITTFVSPHLFWFFESSKLLDRTDLEVELEATLLKPVLDDPIVGELVAVLKNDVWQRAVVQSIVEDTYHCWSLDYGAPLRVKHVYKLPDHFKIAPPFTKKACLNNLVYLVTELNFETSEVQYEETCEFVKGSSQIIMKHLENAKELFLVVDIIKEGTYFGDIVYFKDKKKYSLTQILIDDKIMSRNENLFEKAIALCQEEFENNIATRSSSRSSISNVITMKNCDETMPDASGRGRRLTEEKTPPKISVGKKLRNLSKILSSEVPKTTSISETESLNESWLSLEKDESENSSVKLSDVKSLTHKKVSKEDEPLEKHANSTPKLLNIKPEGTRTARPAKKVSKNIKNPKRTTKPDVPKQSTPNQSRPLKRFTIVNRPSSLSSSISHTGSVSSRDTKHVNPTATSSETNKTSGSERFFESHSDDDGQILNRKKKIGCKCKNCLRWDVNDIKREKKEEFADKKTGKRKTIEKPTLLFRDKSAEEQKFAIKSLTSLPSFQARKKTLIKTPTVLVHGVTIPAPCNAISDMYFHQDVHHYFIAHNFEQPKLIQLYVWPAIMRNSNVCYVGNAKSGKTMAYVPPLLTFLMDRTRYESFPETATGPIVLIVCSGVEKAEEVHKMFYDFSKGVRDCFRVALAVPPLDTACKRQFTKPLDALITTPRTLVTLLENRILNLKRLSHFVCEDIDVLLEKHGPDMSNLLGLLQSVLENRVCKIGIQMILSSEHWTAALENLIQSFALPPLICIGAYLEAALYGRVGIKVHFLEAKQKSKTLVEILTSDDNRYNKCIVICNTDSELDSASDLFDIRSISFVAIKSSLAETVIHERAVQWCSSKPGNCAVLLCTDDVLNKNLCVTDATILIHYSLPSSWTHFTNRFSSLIECLDSPLNFKNKTKEEMVICKSYIFVDEACETQCPKLIDMLNKTGVNLSPSFLQHYKNALLLKETQKIKQNVSLCRLIKLFGECTLEKCDKRHLLSKELDVSESTPKNGKIKYKIVHVEDVTIFSINIVEHNSLDGSTHKNKFNCELIETELTSVLKKKKRSVDDISIGDWVALEDTSSYNEIVYRRCQVQKIVHRDKVTKLPSTVIVKFLDLGGDKRVNVGYLYHLPEEYKKIPPLAFTIYFANLVPPDGDRHYRSYSREKVINFLRFETDEKYKDSVFESEIVLQIGHNLWVKNINLVTDLQLSKAALTVLRLKEKLLKENLADYRDDCLGKLKALCVETGIEVPEIIEKKVEVVKKRTQVKPQWAFLDETEEYFEVYFSAANSPREFYVTRSKFQETFERLQKELQKVANQSNLTDVGVVEVGLCYLAKDETSNEYARVLVTQVQDEMADCFFVDYGDQNLIPKNQLKFLPDEYITKLPFQVIECGLFGIQPVLDNWSPTSTDIFYDNCFEPGTNFYRSLFAVIRKKEKPRLTGGEKFIILLADVNKSKKTVFNKILIETSVAIEHTEEDLSSKEFPDILVENVSDEEEKEDEEKILTLEEANEIVQREFETNEVNDEERCSSRGSEQSWDFEIFDKNSFIKSMGINLNANEIENSIGDRRSDDLPPIKALPAVDYFTPQVKWYQTDVHIKINILLLGVQNYTLKLLRGKMLHFSCLCQSKPYRLDLQLYEKIEKIFTHSTGGQVINMVLTKCKKEEWPRLVLQQGMKHITYDFSRCLFADEPEKPLLSIGDNFNESLADDENDIYSVGSDYDNSESDVASSSISD